MNIVHTLSNTRYVLLFVVVFTFVLTFCDGGSVLEKSRNSIGQSTNNQDQICPQNDLRPDSEVDHIIDEMKRIPMEEDRVAFLKSEVEKSTKAFSGDQTARILPQFSFSRYMVESLGILNQYIISLTPEEIISIIKLYSFSSDRLVVLKVIKDTLSNDTESSKEQIVNNCFTFSSDKEKAREMLKDVTARDCIFGSVTERSAAFVIDTSGSMSQSFTWQGKQYTRLSFVKEHLMYVIQKQLQPYQQFNVIRFSDSTSAWESKPVNATKENIERALTFVSKLSYGGGTSTLSALKAAFEPKNTTGVYLLSDGLPTDYTPEQIVKSVEQLNQERQKEWKIRIFATAFLLGSSSPSEKKKSAEFMESLAEVTGGVYRNIDTNTNDRKVN